MHFPVVFSLKVVGTVEAKLEPIILSALKKHKVDTKHTRISERFSTGWKYVSFTVTFMAKSQAQLDDIYRELSSNPLVIIVI